LLEPVTVAWNWAVPPAETVAEVGDMVMAIVGDGEELLPCDPPPPQATIERSRQFDIKILSIAVEWRRIRPSGGIVTFVALIDEPLPG
jgi:hypothetical protein